MDYWIIKYLITEARKQGPLIEIFHHFYIFTHKFPSNILYFQNQYFNTIISCSDNVNRILKLIYSNSILVKISNNINIIHKNYSKRFIKVY